MIIPGQAINIVVQNKKFGFASNTGSTTGIQVQGNTVTVKVSAEVGTPNTYLQIAANGVPVFDAIKILDDGEF